MLNAEMKWKMNWIEIEIEFNLSNLSEMDSIVTTLFLFTLDLLMTTQGRYEEAKRHDLNIELEKIEIIENNWK